MAESILYGTKHRPVSPSEPFWQDLNLEALVNNLCIGRRNHGVEEACRTAVDRETCRRRQDLFRDLRRDSLRGLLRSFVCRVEQMEQRQQANGHLPNRWQRRWQQTADCLEYYDRLQELQGLLAREPADSEAVAVLRRCLEEHSLTRQVPRSILEARTLLEELQGLRLRVRCFRGTVEVTRETRGEDYGQALARTFSQFRDQETRDYTYRRFTASRWLNRVEEGIAEGAARLYPEPFRHLEAFGAAHEEPVTEQLHQLAEELQFYLAWAEDLEPFVQQGLRFCLPVFTEKGGISACGSFDLALAHEIGGGSVISNDVEASPEERIFVITGANQGGKTTYARMVGQLVWLAQLGVPVPGSRVRLHPVDRIFTHFEREETVETENGKLMDDLERMHAILQRATADSLILMNETFSSTTVTDAIWLAERILQQGAELGSLCFYVTFLDGRLQVPGMVSLRSQVGPGGARTYRIVRGDADGRAYAVAMADSHHLLYDQIRERMQQ